VVPPGDGTGGATSTTTTGTTTTTSTGGGGSGGGCVSDCGERLCGTDVCGNSCGPLLDTWALAVPHHTADLTLHEASSSLFVPGDLTTVERVNLCTGEILASTTIGDPNDVDPHYQRGAGLIGDDLLIGTNYQGKVGEVFVLDRQTLAESAAPIPVTPVGTGDDNIWTATVHDGAFWLSPDNDGDAIIRVDPVSRQATRFDFGTQTMGRGLVSTPYGLVKNWGDKRLALFDTTQCTTTCPAPATLGPLDTLAFKIKYGSNAIFHVSFDGDVGTLTRVDMPAFTTVTKVVNEVGAGLDGWVDVAVWNDVVYVSGASGGIAGLPWVAAYPANFNDQSVPMYETFLDSKGDVNWSVTVDAFGVYVSGNTATGGYVIKCTHELDCPALP
jgi:hypothetical protein